MSFIVFNGGRALIPWAVNGHFPQGLCPCCRQWSMFRLGEGCAYCVVCAGLVVVPFDTEELEAIVLFRRNLREEEEV